jgi:hypothetical protein
MPDTVKDLGNSIKIPSNGTNIIHSKQILYTAKNQCRKIETNIPRKGIALSQSQFLHLFSVREFYIPTIDLSILLQEIQYVDRSWEYINRSQTLECGNWGRAIPRKVIHKWDFHCSVCLLYTVQKL